jgi:multidrug efflux pump subunit AcrB
VVTLLVTLVIAGLAFARVATIPQDLFDTEDFTLFYVDIEMPAGTPISRTDEVVAAYEREITPLVGNGEVAAVNAFVGFAGGQTQNQRAGNVAQLIVDLTERDQGRERSIDEVIEQVRRRTRGIAGPEQVQFRKQQTGPPTDPPVSFRLFGDRYEDLSAVADAFKRRLSDFPILVNIDDNLDEGTPELRIEVDDALAARYGLSAEGIGNFIRSSFDGVRAGSVFSENEETDVIVGYSERRPFTVDTLAQLRLPTQSGSFIPFSAVAEINEAQAISTIRRIDGSREATVTAETTGDQDVRDINNEIERLFSEELASQYPGVELNVGGEFAEIADTIFEILRVFVIGLFLIYTILATQFKSYTQPLLILFSVPLAFIGVILYLLVSGTPLSTTVIYAGVALAGIAVNDTIVLLSFVRERRNDGYSVAEAVVDAASTRLRPILLTSITTIAGLLPTAIGIGGRSVIWGPLASTIIFGLLFSTVTALVVVPALYGLLYDRSKKSPKTEAS